MLPLMELFDMVSLNEAVLSDTERQALLKARLALGIFERAMQRFKSEAAAGSSDAAELRVSAAAATMAVGRVEMLQPGA